MPAPYPQLPFPRGTTFSQGAYTPTATDGSHLEGQMYVVPDENNPGAEKVLRVVRAPAAGMTAARKVVAFSTVGTVASGYANAVGKLGKPLDDAYDVGFAIPGNDLFYVVESGTTTVEKESGALILKFVKCFSNATGGVAPTGGGWLIGLALDNALAADLTVKVYVTPGFVEAAAESTITTTTSTTTTSTVT